ncbi:MAG: Type 1 glutamine amidotransferase-like domain-containing protein [Actinomycetales bacterium]
MIDFDRLGWLLDTPSPDGTGAIVAYGGAGVSGGATEASPVEVALVRGVSRGGRRPVVCLIPTASGDSDAVMDAFRTAFAAAGAEPHVLSLFRRTEAPFADLLDRADLVYVTGGAVANLAALWRLHDLDDDLARRWRHGLPLAGSSAGALIWSSGGVTTSFGQPRRWTDGLRLLPSSLCPHADTQPERAALYRQLVTEGQLPGGYCLDERAAGVFCGGELAATLGDDATSTVHCVVRE